MVITGVGDLLDLFLSFIEECTVPAYIIHHSENCEDYSIYFRVEEITENLQNGILIQPKIEVWSGRSDLNKTRLARNLRREFLLQLEKEKTREISD